MRISQYVFQIMSLCKRPQFQQSRTELLVVAKTLITSRTTEGKLYTVYMIILNGAVTPQTNADNDVLVSLGSNVRLVS